MKKRRSRREIIELLAGATFGKWTVIDPEPKNKKVLVRCKCSTEKMVNYTGLFAGKSRGCTSCRKGKTTWFERNKDKKIGYLTIIKRHPETARKIWCKCECGNEKYYNSQELRLGHSKSCGCKTLEMRKESNLKKYGVGCSLQNAEVKSKIKKTLIERYGVDNPMKSQEIKKKSNETNLERYGTKWSGSSNHVIKKTLENRIRNNYESAGEAEMRQWITETFGASAEKSYCGGANPCEIDIHIPEKGISIEYNGDYWHSERADRGRQYHLSKSESVAAQKGSHLIHIFDSEWRGNQEAVKAFLSGKLTKGVPVRASKCEIREVDWDTAKEFCSLHLQGKPRSSILNLGLYYNNEIVSLMTFSKPHRQNMESLPNLSRYVIKPGYRIHGGLTRLSKHAHERLGDFITFVHLRLSDGKSYEKAGYKLVKKLPPDYWYWDTVNNGVVSKQSRRKSSVGTPKNITEKEHAEMDGLFRIWDCGKLKFIYC